MVNHYKNFVNPYTGAHCNTIEGTLGSSEKEAEGNEWDHKSQTGVSDLTIGWRQIHHMLSHIAEIVPPN